MYKELISKSNQTLLKSILKRNSQSLKGTTIELDGTKYNVIMYPSVISSRLGYRVSSNGFEAFDYEDDIKTVFIYHAPSRSIENLLLSVNKLMGHLPDFISSVKNKDYINKHTKGIVHIPGSNSREILIGNLMDYKFYYESNKDKVTNITKEDLIEF